MTKKDSVLDEILGSEEELFSAVEEAQVLKPLEKEIEMIIDPNIKSFVKSILFRSKSFWDIPSSFSGKYHPLDEHNKGGNVLHTKRVIRCAKVICESQSICDEERDLIYAACLLHDVTKGIIDSDGQHFQYDPMHPYTVGTFVKKCQEYDKKYAGESHSSTLFLSEETVQSILRLVRCHLGPWSPVPETIPITYLDMIVHLADNLASKLHYLVDGENIIEERWKF